MYFFSSLANSFDNAKAQVLADTLDAATSKFLLNYKSPSRKVNELDNRGSHFYLALYWAEELAAQDKDAELKAQFADLAAKLSEQEETIVSELNGAQGVAMNIGGYYKPNDEQASEAMRPSASLNAALASL